MSRTKSALSLTLIVCVVASALPATAQGQTTTPGSVDLRDPASHGTGGPLARAATREAVRLAAASEPVPSGGEAAQQMGKPAKSSWSRVRELDPGTEITLTVKGSRPGQRHFIAGDESYLTVLNVEDPARPAAATLALVDTASEHPIYFVLAQQGGTFLLQNNVHLTPEGIFVGEEKVAELEQIVEQIARDRVAEISVLARRVRRATGWGAAIGAGTGFVTGLLSGMSYCESRTCDTFPPIAIGFIYGILGGGIGSGIGATLGASHKTRDLIYRAP
jgi:hypothetical protein